MSIEKLRSGRYRADLRDQHGKRIRKTFDRLKDAERWQRNTKQEVEDRIFVSPKDIPTFGEAAEEWSAGKSNYRNSSRAFWRNHTDNYLVPSIGMYRLDRIDVKLVEHVRDKVRGGKKPGEGLSPRTVNKILTTGAAICKFAMRRGLMKSNPFTLAERLREESGDLDGASEGAVVTEEDVYSADEIGRLLKAAEPDREYAMILTAALTGIRHGELLALQWADLDLEEGKVTIRRSVSWAKAPKGLRDQGGEEAAAIPQESVARSEFKFTRPKTRAGLRTIPLAAELVSALKRWKLKCPPNDLGLVFPSDAGQPLQRKSVLNALHRTQRRAKLRELDVKALRHTFAPQLVAAGRAVTEVQYLMGHANPVVTLRVYSHWFKRTEGTGVADLAKAILGSGASEGREGAGHSADTKAGK